MAQVGNHDVRYSSTSSVPKKGTSFVISKGDKVPLSSENRSKRVFGSWKVSAVDYDN